MVETTQLTQLQEPIEIDITDHTNPIYFQLKVYKQPKWNTTIRWLQPRIDRSALNIGENEDPANTLDTNKPGYTWFKFRASTEYFDSSSIPSQTLTISNLSIIVKKRRPNDNEDGNENNNEIDNNITTFNSPLIRRNLKFNSLKLFSAVNYQPPIITKSFPIQLNCQTGEYTMITSYNVIKWPNGTLEDLTNNISKNDPKAICYLSSLRNGQSYSHTQSIGNAILFNNLMFSEQNHFDQTAYQVKRWTQEDKLLSYKLNYDGDIPLQNFDMKYKNLYL